MSLFRNLLSSLSMITKMESLSWWIIGIRMLAVLHYSHLIITEKKELLSSTKTRKLRLFVYLNHSMSVDSQSWRKWEKSLLLKQSTSLTPSILSKWSLLLKLSPKTKKLTNMFLNLVWVKRKFTGNLTL